VPETELQLVFEVLDEQRFPLVVVDKLRSRVGKVTQRSQPAPGSKGGVVQLLLELSASAGAIATLASRLDELRTIVQKWVRESNQTVRISVATATGSPLSVVVDKDRAEEFSHFIDMLRVNKGSATGP
jgi:hypothetical protein